MMVRPPSALFVIVDASEHDMTFLLPVGMYLS